MIAASWPRSHSSAATTGLWNPTGRQLLKAAVGGLPGTVWSLSGRGHAGRSSSALPTITVQAFLSPDRKPDRRIGAPENRVGGAGRCARMIRFCVLCSQHGISAIQMFGRPSIGVPGIATCGMAGEALVASTVMMLVLCSGIAFAGRGAARRCYGPVAPLLGGRA